MYEHINKPHLPEEGDSLQRKANFISRLFFMWECQIRCTWVTMGDGDWDLYMQSDGWPCNSVLLWCTTDVEYVVLILPLWILSLDSQSPLNVNRLSFLSTVTVATGRLSILPSSEEEQPHTMWWHGEPGLGTRWSKIKEMGLVNRLGWEVTL